MAKEIEKDSSYEIIFEQSEDPATFVRSLRTLLSKMTKNVTVNMTTAPILANNTFASLVFSAKALKAKGISITIMLNRANYDIMKSAPDIEVFSLDCVASEKPVEKKSSPFRQVKIEKDDYFFPVVGNKIFITEEQSQAIPTKLAETIKELSIRSHDGVIVDITNIELLTPPMLQTIALETLNYGALLQVHITDEMMDIVENAPQASILNIVKVEKSTAPSAAVSSLEDTSPLQKTLEIEGNTVFIGDTTSKDLIANLGKLMEKVFETQDACVVNLDGYEHIDLNLAKLIYSNTFKLASNGKHVHIQMTSEQHEQLASHLPHFQILDAVAGDFTLEGNQLSVGSINSDHFVTHFKNHLGKALKNNSETVVIDLSRMTDFSVAAALEAIQGHFQAMESDVLLEFTLRAEMQAVILEQNKGRFLNLNAVQTKVTEVSPQQARAPKKSIKPTIDMSKILAAQEKDKLSSKVLDKQYEKLSMGSAGAVDNWQAGAKKEDDRKPKYSGPERRRGQRYKGEGIEAVYSKNMDGPVTGRSYEVRNCSLRGVCFVSPVQLGRKEQVLVELSDPAGNKVQLKASVVWCTSYPAQSIFHVGAKYTDISLQARNQLQKWITDRSFDE